MIGCLVHRERSPRTPKSVLTRKRPRPCSPSSRGLFVLFAAQGQAQTVHRRRGDRHRRKRGIDRPPDHGPRDVRRAKRNGPGRSVASSLRLSAVHGLDLEHRGICSLAAALPSAGIGQREILAGGKPLGEPQARLAASAFELHLLERDDDRDRQRHVEALGDLDAVRSMEAE
jgi:hypothetical protein